VSKTARIAATFRRFGISRHRTAVVAADRPDRAGSHGSGAPSRHALLILSLTIFAVVALLGVASAWAAGLRPTAVTGGVTHLAADHAYLQAQVNPNGEATTFSFKYGTEDCFESPCTVIPANETREAGEGAEALTFAQAVGGLQPSTTYHYRVLAENASGFSEGLDRTFTTAPEVGQNCPNEAAREVVHATALPNCRAWEMVSPPAKNGSGVLADSGHVRAAAEETPALPMAASFSSFGAFADAAGTGAAAAEYIAERTLEPGTNGWTTHAVTPLQESLSPASVTRALEPVYPAMSEDLTRGVYSAYSPIPTADDPHENVEEVENLYGRDDLRSPGSGTYSLLTDSVVKLPTPGFFAAREEKPFFAGASADFHQVAFESKLPLTADAGSGPKNFKTFKASGGQLRFVTAGSPTCPGGRNQTQPCSVAGRGAEDAAGLNAYTVSRALSADGSRLEFSSPERGFATLSLPEGSPTPGITSKLFQLDDQSTLDPSDDAVIQVNTSEKSSPDIAQLAAFQTASTEGSRVFFASTEQLTDAPLGAGVGLYLWARQDTNETQQVSVDAEGGTFTLTARSQPTVGIGNLTAGSATVEEVKGSFSVGQTIEGASIPAGTTVVAMGSFSEGSTSTLTLSQPAEATASEVALKGAMQATTPPLPYNATAAEVQSALENLHFSAKFPELPLLGKGNVEVTGGPGNPGAETPYSVTFTGALEGVNVVQMSADGSSLTGGASTASVSTTVPVQNLTLLGPVAMHAGSLTVQTGVVGMLGAGEDGHRAYFVTTHAGRTGIFYWQDAGGAPGGVLSFVAPLTNTHELGPQGINEAFAFAQSDVQRVSPDGKRLLFASALVDPVGYEPGSCASSLVGEGICTELYLYSAQDSTPSDPNVVCVSCDLGEPGEPNLAPYGDSITAVKDIELTGVTLSARHITETRNISASGHYVFFSTARALVPADTNGVLDAYEYDTQTEAVQLLSSGTDPYQSFFLDASQDGSNAFILTRARLSGWDVDKAYDLYDVRIDGGVPEPVAQTAECEGESCKVAAPPAPPAPVAGSAALTGPENPSQRPCPRGRRAVRKGGKTRCVKKHHKRAANSNRRAGR
jgi:hypothetical protein